MPGSGMCRPFGGTGGQGSRHTLVTPHKVTKLADALSTLDREQPAVLVAVGTDQLCDRHTPNLVGELGCLALAGFTDRRGIAVELVGRLLVAAPRTPPDGRAVVGRAGIDTLVAHLGV